MPVRALRALDQRPWLIPWDDANHHRNIGNRLEKPTFQTEPGSLLGLAEDRARHPYLRRNPSHGLASSFATACPCDIDGVPTNNLLLPPYCRDRHRALWPDRKIPKPGDASQGAGIETVVISYMGGRNELDSS